MFSILGNSFDDVSVLNTIKTIHEGMELLNIHLVYIPNPFINHSSFKLSITIACFTCRFTTNTDIWTSWFFLHFPSARINNCCLRFLAWLAISSPWTSHRTNGLCHADRIQVVREHLLVPSLYFCISNEKMILKCFLMVFLNAMGVRIIACLAWITLFVSHSNLPCFCMHEYKLATRNG